MHPKNTPIKLRDALEDALDEAGWRAREAALTVEEGVVWKSADAVRDLAERAGETPVGRGAGRLRWHLDRRLLWPLTDRLREQGDLARTAIGTAAVALALASVTGGAMLASGGEDAPAQAPQFVAAAEVASGDTLEGVTPNFTSSQGGPAAAPVRAKPAPKDPIGRTAWDFAQAFVLYEVGGADEAAEKFEQLATPALAHSLSESPPRLPADVKVPEARVLNVVVGKPHAADPAPDTPRQDSEEMLVEASVSMVRLQAVSELRLTLKQDGKVWRVTEIRG
jgi:hypothetical protein